MVKKIPILTIAWIGIVGMILWAMSSIEITNTEEKKKAVEDFVMRSAVHCYSLEGKYPSNIDYLEENYHLHIDRERYIVHYESFASNIAPDITVILK